MVPTACAYDIALGLDFREWCLGGGRGQAGSGLGALVLEGRGVSLGADGGRGAGGSNTSAIPGRQYLQRANPLPVSLPCVQMVVQRHSQVSEV